MLVCTATVTVDVSSYRINDVAWNKKPESMRGDAIVVRRNCGETQQIIILSSVDDTLVEECQKEKIMQAVSYTLLLID